MKKFEFKKINYCPVCESNEIKLFFKNNSLNETENNLVKFKNIKLDYSKWYFCCSCTHLFLNPIFEEEFSNSLYEKDGFYRKLSKLNFGEDKYLDSIDNSKNKNVKGLQYYNLKRILKRNTNIYEVLDFGAGFGSAKIPFEQNKLEYIGIEIDEYCLQKAKALNRNVVKPEKIKNKYDLVYSNQVFEHIKDPSYGIKENLKYLKDDGYIFINVPTYETSLLNNYSKGGVITLNWFHYHSYSRKSIEKLLNDFSLDIVDIWLKGSDVNVLAKRKKTISKKIKPLSFRKAKLIFEIKKFIAFNLYPSLIQVKKAAFLLNDILKGRVGWRLS